MHIENYTEEKTKCINFNHGKLRDKQRSGLNEHFRIQARRKQKTSDENLRRFEDDPYGEKAKVKLIRAYGGCLGVSSRRRTR